MPSVKISSLPVGVAEANAILIVNNAGNTQTTRVTAGAIAALSGPVHSVAGRTGAVAITAGDISNFNAAAASVCGTASPVTSVNGATGAVSINATSIGAAPTSHTHATGDITNFASAVAVIAGTTGPVASVNGLTGAVTITAGAVSSVNGVTGAVSLNAASVGAATATHAAQHMRGGTDPFLLVMSSLTALTQDENNLSLPASDVVYISAATTNRDITGFTGGSTGRAVLVINTGLTHTLTIKHNHTSSATANRVLAKGATDVAVTANGHAALLVYDTGESRWRAV